MSSFFQLWFGNLLSFELVGYQVDFGPDVN